MESGGYASHVYDFVHVHGSIHACQHACTLFSGMLRPISQPIWVGSERWRYLWNREDMPVMTMMSVHVHAHMLDCMHITFWCALANISAKSGQIRVIKISMDSGEHAGPL